MARVRGVEGVTRKLRRIGGKDIIRRVGAALYAGGDLIAAEAHVSITKGSVSGKGHVPSKPGEPPNNDTGVLVGNIEVVQKAPLVVHVSSNAPYSAPLEFGSPKMEARPFMRPARDAKKQEVIDLVTKAVDEAMKGK